MYKDEHSNDKDSQFTARNEISSGKSHAETIKTLNLKTRKS